MRFLMILVTLALAAAAANAQQVYRWVDKNGNVNYTQTPPPAEAATSIQRKEFGAGGDSAPELPYATQVAMKNFPVTLYTSPECGNACADSRHYLDGRGVPYKEVSVTDEKSVAELERIVGKAYVPVLVVGSDVQRGYQVDAWKTALDAAGYLASAPRIQRQPVAKKSLAAPGIPSGDKLPVRLYTSPNCGAICNSAREVLVSRDVPFQEITVDTAEKVAELNKLSGGTTVPTLVVGSAAQRGFEASLYNNALDAGGYARPAAANK